MRINHSMARGLHLDKLLPSDDGGYALIGRLKANTKQSLQLIRDLVRTLLCQGNI